MDDFENKDIKYMYNENKSELESREEKSYINSNKNEIEKKLDLDFTDTIKKDIDTLIEEKLKNYFEKRNISENSLDESDVVELEEDVSHTSLFEENRITIDVGSIIEVAGEYECCKCNFKRMYVKGDIAVKCENPECLTSLSGWRLSFDLF